jgi:uncharacterized membrane protein HdeD (DUF308 family)
VVNVVSTTTEAAKEVARGEKLLPAVGVAMIFLGVAAFFFPFSAALATELLIGGFLIAMGILRIAEVWHRRSWQGFAYSLMSGLLAIVVGGWLLWFPLAGVTSLTLVVAIFFILDGLLRVTAAVHRRPQNSWRSGLALGGLSLLLGTSVLFFWPYASAWLLGLLIGVDLIVSGAHQLFVFAAERRKLKVRLNNDLSPGHPP